MRLTPVHWKNNLIKINSCCCVVVVMCINILKTYFEAYLIGNFLFCKIKLNI